MKTLSDSHRRGLHIWACLTAASTFVLLIAGGLVTSNDAGLAVPDWPLSFGGLMPEMVGGVFYEHGHRMIAGAVALMTLVLAIWAGLREERRWVRRLAYLAFASVLLQALLGGMTVLFQLPVIVSVLHACLAQTFFCMVVALALVTSKYWKSSQHGLGYGWDRPEFRAVGATFIAIYLQLILGAFLRHTGTVGGTKGAVIAPLPLIGHLAGALLVTVVLLFALVTLVRMTSDTRALGLGVVLIALLISQLVLGVGALMIRMTVASRAQPFPTHAWITTGHLALGALLLAVSLMLALLLTRRELSRSVVGLSSGNLAEGAS